MLDKDWNEKINRARYVEKQILRWVQKADPNARLTDNYFPQYDIESKVFGNLEVKEDKIASRTNNYAIEFEDYQGNPSGLALVTAKEFVIVDFENVVFIKTESLKWLIEQLPSRKYINMGYKTLTGRTAKGWLIPRGDILFNPLAVVYERWFPTAAIKSVSGGFTFDYEGVPNGDRA